MPTWEEAPGCRRDYDNLSADQKREFKRAVRKFVEDLKKGQGLAGCRPGLRIKGVQGRPGLFEITWADDGRAVFKVGESKRNGEPHIVWVAIGTHAVL